GLAGARPGPRRRGGGGGVSPWPGRRPRPRDARRRGDAGRRHRGGHPAGARHGSPVTRRKHLTHTVEETQALGEALGGTLGPGAVVACVGDLGTGKTAFL